MTSQSNQITPSSQSVVRFEDKVIINMLGSHSTFEVNNLLEIIPKECLDINKLSLQFRVELANLVDEIPEKGSSKQYFLDKVQNLVKKYGANTNGKISQAFLDGVVCSLLEPNGKGWQKGTIKICFEFIPEEEEPVVMEENLETLGCSSLDEIRQLANSLSIDQN
jgi:KGK domain